MFDFEHTIAKKYYGTSFESSLAVAVGVCLSCCCPTIHQRSNPRIFLGLSLRGVVQPPLLKEPLGCTHRDAIGVETLPARLVCSLCTSMNVSKQVGAARHGTGWRRNAQFGHRTPSDASQQTQARA